MSKIQRPVYMISQFVCNKCGECRLSMSIPADWSTIEDPISKTIAYLCPKCTAEINAQKESESE